MTQLSNFVASHLGVIGLVIIVGCGVMVLMILMLFIQSRRIALLSERLDYLTQGVDGQSLEGVLDTHLDTVMRVAHDLDELTARMAILEGGSRLHFGRLGLVRFNPFDDTGGNQSFALAILDANNDGFVVSSLHSRTGTRLYAKAIFGGESESVLGAEEAQAVEIAVSQGGGLPTSLASKSAAAAAKAGKAAGRTKAAGSASGGARPSRAAKPVAVAGASAGAKPASPAKTKEADVEPVPDDAGSATPSA